MSNIKERKFPKKPLILVTGATGTGKTRIAIEIAESIHSQLDQKAEIINFDSIQFYK